MCSRPCLSHSLHFTREFALACSSIRMRFYSIEPIDRIEAIRILGNSLPAVATATAVAAGLACVHLLRLVRRRDLLCRARSLSFQEQETLRDLFSSADVSLETLQPVCFSAKSANQNRIGTASWTSWDVWRVEGNPRVRDLWEFLKGRGIDLRMLAEVSYTDVTDVCFSCVLSTE
jgi:ubiquitin-activating enzyme E1